MDGFFDGVDVLSFDCYGTIIDWERGILDAMAPLLEARDVLVDDDALLERFALAESGHEAGPWVSYRRVLERVVDSLGNEFGFEPTDAERTTFAASVARWPPFGDSREALARLSSRFDLAVVSNVDDDLFAASAGRLGVPFREVVTAQQVRSYKPDPAHFHTLLERVGGPASRIVHVAQSLYHDIAPARSLGWRTVHVDRRAGRSGGGATPAATARPDRVVPTLAALAEAAGV